MTGVSGRLGRTRTARNLMTRSPPEPEREKVTNWPIFAANAGPTPRTLCRPASDPNAPRAERSATIRAARTGPIDGSDAMAAASAVSTSTSWRSRTALANEPGCDGARPGGGGETAADPVSARSRSMRACTSRFRRATSRRRLSYSASGSGGGTSCARRSSAARPALLSVAPDFGNCDLTAGVPARWLRPRPLAERLASVAESTASICRPSAARDSSAPRAP